MSGKTTRRVALAIISAVLLFTPSAGARPTTTSRSLSANNMTKADESHFLAARAVTNATVTAKHKPDPDHYWTNCTSFSGSADDMACCNNNGRDGFPTFVGANKTGDIQGLVYQYNSDMVEFAKPWNERGYTHFWQAPPTRRRSLCTHGASKRLCVSWARDDLIPLHHDALNAIVSFAAECVTRGQSAEVKVPTKSSSQPQFMCISSRDNWCKETNFGGRIKD